MGSEVAPEFIFDQQLYYPAAANYYGYYCPAGTELPSEWDDHHRFLSSDGQDLQFSGLQAESLPYVYCPPNYEYAQSPYNPYNPYIPGAPIMGIDGPFIGSQQYFNESSFQQTLLPPPYVPIVDTVPYTSSDSLISTSGGKYAPLPSSVGVTPSPLKASLQNPTFETFRPSSHQIPNAGRPFEGSLVNAAPSRHRAQAGGIAPYMTQGTDFSSHGTVSSARGPLKVAMASNNDQAYLESGVREWPLGGRSMPRAHPSGISSRNLIEQNRGPRINRTRGLAYRAYPTKEDTGDLDVNIGVHADQYNRDDFPVDYSDAKFFVIKSYSEDDVHKSIKYNVWSSTSSGNKRLDIAYGEAQNMKPRKCPVFLFFSVNASGHFCGVAEMLGPVDFHKDMDFWLQDKWTGSFPVKWHIVKDVPNSSFRHIILINNEHRPVTSSRDTQEIPYLPGISMLTIFKKCPVTTSILDDYMYYEECQRITQEEKSRSVSRRSYQAVFLPTSIKVDGATNKPLNMDDGRLNDTMVQNPVSDPQEPPNAKKLAPESNGKPDHHTVDQDLKAEAKQQSTASCNPSSDGARANGIPQEPLKSIGDVANNAKSPRSDGVQLNCGVNQLKDTTIKHKLPVDGKDPGKKDAKSSESEIGENDGSEVLTVGSMQIKVNMTNSSFTGTLTLGANPVDIRGLKLQ